MIRKVLGALVVLLLIGVVGLFLYARSVLSSESVRTTLEQQLSERLGQPVTIGSANASIFPRVALQLTDVTIGKASPMTVGRISIATGLGGLFSRRVEDAEIVLSEGRVPLPASLVLVPAASEETASADGASFTVVSVRVISLRDIDVVVGSTTLRVDLESALEGDRLAVSQLTAESPHTRLEASGELTSVKELQGTFSVNADPLDVDELLTLTSGMTSASPAPGPAGRAKPTPMSLVVDIKASKGRFAGFDFSNLGTKLDARPGRISMSGLTLSMFGGTYDGTLNLDSSAATPRLQLRGSVKGIDVSQLATLAGAPGSITGQLAGSVALACDGTDASSMLRTARGTSSAQITNGVIPGLDMVRTIVLAFGKPTGAPPEGSGSAFSRLGGDFNLQNGLVRTDTLSFQSRDFDMNGRAALTVPGGAINATVDVILSEELTAQAGTDLRRYAQEDGRVIVPARISGTIGDPQVTPDITAAVARALQNELKRRAKSFIEGLFKKKK
jgi:uncharacterized protein involved in outer membrane biogenesis